MRILICVNGVLKHVNTPDSYLRERCANGEAQMCASKLEGGEASAFQRLAVIGRP